MMSRPWPEMYIFASWIDTTNIELADRVVDLRLTKKVGTQVKTKSSNGSRRGAFRERGRFVSVPTE
jgi:hypothetical protein